MSVCIFRAFKGGKSSATQQRPQDNMIESASNSSALTDASRSKKTRERYWSRSLIPAWCRPLAQLTGRHARSHHDGHLGGQPAAHFWKACACGWTSWYMVSMYAPSASSARSAAAIACILQSQAVACSDRAGSRSQDRSEQKVSHQMRTHFLTFDSHAKSSKIPKFLRNKQSKRLGGISVRACRPQAAPQRSWSFTRSHCAKTCAEQRIWRQSRVLRARTRVWLRASFGSEVRAQ